MSQTSPRNRTSQSATLTKGSTVAAELSAASSSSNSAFSSSSSSTSSASNNPSSKNNNSSAFSSLSYPATEGAPSQEDFLSFEKKTLCKSRLAKVFLFGLVLYVLDIGLQLAITVNYLQMRECHRGISQEFVDFKVSDLMKIKKEDDQDDQTENLEKWIQEAPGTPEEEADLLQSFVNERILIRVRNRLINLVPQHWIDKIVKIVNFQLSKYEPVQISDMCRINSRNFSSTFEMGLYICDAAFTPEQKRVLSTTVAGISREDENAILGMMIAKAWPELFAFVPGALGLDLPADALEIVGRITRPLNPEELADVMRFLDDPYVQSSIGPAFEIYSEIDPQYIQTAKEAFGKINPKNLPLIDEKLGKLNVSLTDFVTDPSLFVKFIQNPQLGAVLLEVQTLLPLFQPSDLNAIITIKNAFEEDPRTKSFLGKLFTLPMATVAKMTSVELNKRERIVLRQISLVFKEKRAKDMLKVVRDLNLLPEATRAQELQRLTSKCRLPRMRIACSDPSVDLCPHGHLVYAFVTLSTLAFPAILYALSEFLTFGAFKFGGLFGEDKSYGGDWNPALKWALVPLYIVVMIPLKFFITCGQYVKVLRRIFHLKSPSAIQESSDTATHLHSLEGSGNAFVQIMFQLYILLLFVVLGTGTVIAGVDIIQILQDVVPLSIVSIAVSIFNFTSTSWRLRKMDHRLKNLRSPSNRSQPQTTSSYLPRWFDTSSFMNGFTFLSWLLVSKFTQIVSIIFLALVVWIEMFSYNFQVQLNSTILPVLILAAGFAVNVISHKKLIGDKDEFEFAHGAISAIFPARYLNANDEVKTKRFLLVNQSVYWALHVLAWFTYAIIIYLQHSEEAGLLRIMPLMLAFVSLGPFLGAVHWSTAIQPAYERRRRSGEITLPNPSNTPRSKFEVEYTVVQRRPLFYFWQAITALTRVVSFSLMVYVYVNHWLEVEGNLAWLMAAPFVVLIAVANVGLFYAHFRRGFVPALISILVPGTYPAASSTSSAAAPTSRIGRYIILNMGMNLVLHLILWLNMAFYCWECTKVLDEHFDKLSVCFPLAIALWLVNLILTMVAWRISIRYAIPATKAEQAEGKVNSEDDEKNEDGRPRSSSSSSSMSSKSGSQRDENGNSASILTELKSIDTTKL